MKYIETQSEIHFHVVNGKENRKMNRMPEGILLQPQAEVPELSVNIAQSSHTVNSVGPIPIDSELSHREQ